MQKEPWWIRHRTIGSICGMIILVFGLLFFGIFDFFEQVWMYSQGFNYDNVDGGYVHRKTGERR